MLLELEFKKNNYLFQHRIPIEIFSFEFWMFCKTDSADDNPVYQNHKYQTGTPAGEDPPE